MAVGDSPQNLELIELGSGRKAGVMVANPALETDVSHPPKSSSNRFQMYWSQSAARDVVSSVASWFDAESAPVRVVWLSDDFTWFGLPATCDPMDSTCQSIGPGEFNLVARFVHHFSEAGITVFPLLLPSLEAHGARFGARLA